MVEFFQSLPRKQHGVVWAAVLEVSRELADRLREKNEEEERGGEGEKKEVSIQSISPPQDTSINGVLVQMLCLCANQLLTPC